MFCLEPNVLFVSLGKDFLFKNIVLLFQKCFSCISTENKSPVMNPATSLLRVTFFRLCLFFLLEQRIFNAFYFHPTEPSSLTQLDSDMKKQEHLWQNHSPNFLSEKAFNAAVAALQPHCAVCSLFCPYPEVQHTAADAHMCPWSRNSSYSTSS